VPEGFVGADAGRYAPALGRGWLTDLPRRPRLRHGGEDLLHNRFVFAGSSRFSDRWEMALPNGPYFVTVSCGGQVSEQGPHRVVVEGVEGVRDAVTAPGEKALAKDVRVEVRDGRLTLEVGAAGSEEEYPGDDYATDTGLMYLIVREAREAD
jgi:hypothetical protein